MLGYQIKYCTECIYNVCQRPCTRFIQEMRTWDIFEPTFARSHSDTHIGHYVSVLPERMFTAQTCSFQKSRSFDLAATDSFWNRFYIQEYLLRRYQYCYHWCLSAHLFFNDCTHFNSLPEKCDDAYTIKVPTCGVYENTEHMLNTCTCSLTGTGSVSCTLPPHY